MNHHILRATNNVPLECEWNYPSNNGESVPKNRVHPNESTYSITIRIWSHDSRSMLNAGTIKVPRFKNDEDVFRL